MTTLAYLECPTGLAGDMCLGALVDAGVPLEYLRESLQPLGVAQEYKLRAETVLRNGQQATKVYVDLLPQEDCLASSTAGIDPHTNLDHSSNAIAAQPHFPHSSHPYSPSHPPHLLHSTRHLSDITNLISSAHLPARAEAWSLAVFQQLAVAEGSVHGISPEEVHFHEVGAADAIVDIVGTCLGLDWLGVDELYCSAMPTGGGTIRAAHGQLPVPAPAVLKLWEMRQVPIYHNGIERELVTPTGAAIATTLATHFGAPPPMILHKVGLGAGSRQLPIPNMVRLWLGQKTGGSEGKEQKAEGNRLKAIAAFQGTHSHTENHSHEDASPRDHVHGDQGVLGDVHQQGRSEDDAPQEETIAVLETQIDDLNPQAIGYVFEALFAAGAVDVFTQAIGMKKSRPGILLTVICSPAIVSTCKRVLFQETTTLGIRHSLQQRTILHRHFQSVKTPYGLVHVKVASHTENGTVVNVQPEYEDCAALARQQNVPWRTVHQAALRAWQELSLPNA
jgi:pyridinium-3,5-bisthiocarboxylic acid mononucleotide nickel chelatase